MKLRNKKTGKVQTCDMVVITDEKLDGAIASLNKHAFIFRSIEQFNDQYEAYKPTEPLIKDPKIRKIVRAWAECCQFSILEHYFSNGFSCFLCTVEGNDYCLDFNLRIDNLKGSCLYTIAELCGEEE